MKRRRNPRTRGPAGRGGAAAGGGTAPAPPHFLLLPEAPCSPAPRARTCSARSPPRCPRRVPGTLVAWKPLQAVPGRRRCQPRMSSAARAHGTCPAHPADSGGGSRGQSSRWSSAPVEPLARSMGELLCDPERAQLAFLKSSIAFFIVVFLGLHRWHMDVPRLGVES